MNETPTKAPAALQGRPIGGRTRENQHPWDIVPAEVTGDSHSYEQAAGRPLKVWWIRAFESHALGRSWRDIAKELEADGVCVSISRVASLPREDWWKKLVTHIYEERQDSFLLNLTAKHETAAEAMDSILKGEFPDSKQANAAVQGIRVLTEIGPKPLSDRRPQVNVQHNTQNNVVNLNPDKFQMSKEELFEFARTGKRPVPVIE